MSIRRGGLLARGKTKEIYEVQGEPGLCIVHSTDSVTANDDPSLTRLLPNKGAYNTETTCNVFQLLRSCGLPIAFVQRHSDTEFLAPLCRMYPLECVARRFARGSYPKRHPDVPAGKRFDYPEIELYLKTTKGACSAWTGGKAIQLPADPLAKDGRFVEDPLILNPSDPAWTLWHSKISLDDPRGKVGEMQRSAVAPNLSMEEVGLHTRFVFRVLEDAWGRLGCEFADLKIEFGLSNVGRLLVADVITADEWRMQKGGRELSKQAFRDGLPLQDVEGVYRDVAEMSNMLRAA